MPEKYAYRVRILFFAKRKKTHTYIRMLKYAKKYAYAYKKYAYAYKILTLVGLFYIVFYRTYAYIRNHFWDILFRYFYKVSETRPKVLN